MAVAVVLYVVDMLLYLHLTLLLLPFFYVLLMQLLHIIIIKVIAVAVE